MHTETCWCAGTRVSWPKSFNFWLQVMEVTCQSSTTCIPWQRTPASINSVSQMVHATSSFHQPQFTGWTKCEVYFCNHCFISSSGGSGGCMCENMFVYELEERGEVDWKYVCQKIREKFHTMAFEYYRANMHRHVACANVLVCARDTLRAPLSGTFLQTLPDLVTPLKGHSLSPRSFQPTRLAP